MSRTLKTILTIVLIVVGAMWLLTVYRSCNTKKENTEITNGNENLGSNDGTTDDSGKLDDLYEEDDEDESTGESALDAGNTTDTTGGDSEEEEDTSEYEEDDNVSVAGEGIKKNGGEYLVVAGAFISKSNAEKYQKQLSKKGYDSEIRVFIGSDYHSVIIGEYVNRGDAIRTADKIGGEAYAHKKRYPKKRR